MYPAGLISRFRRDTDGVYARHARVHADERVDHGVKGLVVDMVVFHVVGWLQVGWQKDHCHVSDHAVRRMVRGKLALMSHNGVDGRVQEDKRADLAVWA